MARYRKRPPASYYIAAFCVQVLLYLTILDLVTRHHASIEMAFFQGWCACFAARVLSDLIRSAVS